MTSGETMAGQVMVRVVKDTMCVCAPVAEGVDAYAA